METQEYPRQIRQLLDALNYDRFMATLDQPAQTGWDEAIRSRRLAGRNGKPEETSCLWLNDTGINLGLDWFEGKGSQTLIDLQLQLAAEDRPHRAYAAAADDVQVLCGRVPRSVALAGLARQHPDLVSREMIRAESDDRLTCFAFRVDVVGRYIAGSFRLSPLLLAAAQPARPATVAADSPGEIRTFQQLHHQLETSADEQLTTNLPVKLSQLSTLTDRLCELIQPAGLPEEEQALYRRLLLARTYAVDETCLEPSVDLTRMVDNPCLQQLDELEDYYTKRGSAGEADASARALAAYRLSPFETPGMERKDPAHDAEVLQNVLNPSHLSFARWPGFGRSNLPETAALNLAVDDEYCPGPIVTLTGSRPEQALRLVQDLAADQIVRFAAALARYETLQEASDACWVKERITPAFTSADISIPYTEYFYACIEPELANNWMMVAGAPDDFVSGLLSYERLQNSLPPDSHTAVREAFSPETAEDSLLLENGRRVPDVYLTQLAERWLVSARRDEDQEHQEHADHAWGLSGVRIRSRRDLERLQEEILTPLTNSVMNAAGRSDRRTNGVPSTFAEAREAFLEQYDKVRALKMRLEVLPSILGEPDRLREAGAVRQEELTAGVETAEQRAQDEDSRAEELRAELRKLEPELDKLRSATAEAELALQEAEKRAADNRVTRDAQEAACEKLVAERSLIERLLGRWLRTERLQRIRRDREALARADERLAADDAAVEAARAELADRKSGEAEVQVRADEIQAGIDEADNAAVSARTEAAETREQAAKARAEMLGLVQAAEERIEAERATVTLPDRTLISRAVEGDPDALASQPWQTAAFDRERELLVHRALQLRKVFLTGSTAIRHNLNLLSLMWGLIPAELDGGTYSCDFTAASREAAYPALLTSLCTVVPVLCTSYPYSVELLSPVHDPGRLGVAVLLDAGETEQLEAQSILFKFRRSIVYGDPDQAPVQSGLKLSLARVYAEDDYAALGERNWSILELAAQVSEFA